MHPDTTIDALGLKKRACYEYRSTRELAHNLLRVTRKSKPRQLGAVDFRNPFCRQRFSRGRCLERHLKHGCAGMAVSSTSSDGNDGHCRSRDGHRAQASREDPGDGGRQSAPFYTSEHSTKRRHVNRRDCLLLTSDVSRQSGEERKQRNRRAATHGFHKIPQERISLTRETGIRNMNSSTMQKTVLRRATYLWTRRLAS